MRKNKFPGVREKVTYGHILNKKDISYSIRYTVNGIRREETIGWKSEGYTAEEVYNIRSALIKDIETGKAFSYKEQREQRQQEKIANEEALKQKQLKEITFSDLFENYYKPHIKRKNKKSTVEREIGLYEKWLNPFLGDLKLNLISRISLNSLLDKMEKAHLSNRSKNYAIALTRQIFNFAIKHDLYSGINPASKFDELKKEDNSRMKFLSEEDLNNLLDELKKHSYLVYLMALISADCGLRAGEIFKLTWADINLEKRLMLLRDTKNGTDRYAYMTKRVQEELSKLNQDEGNKLLFTSRNGEQIKHISRTFERAVKTLGINKGITDRKQKIVFHSLRHTYASRLVDKGVPIYEVKELLGHKDIKMTIRYSHFNKDRLLKSVQVLDA